MRSLRFVSLLLILASSLLAAQSNPVPFISQPLRPASILPGSAGFSLALSGSGFSTGSILYWNGSPRATTVLSSSNLQATISPTDIARPGTASITVVSPTGGISNVAYFPVRGLASTVSLAISSNLTKPGSVAVGDFNNDGKLDVVIAQPALSQGGTVFVYQGKGDGTFVAPQQFSSSVTPTQITVADFNGDGHLDISVSDTNGYFTAVFLGNGKGHFQQKMPVITGAVEGVADFNADGNLDLILGETDSEHFWSDAYLGHGDGTFSRSQSSVCSAQLVVWSNVAIGDFNRDGNLDVAFPGSVCLGNGDGTFQAGTPTNIKGRAIATADLNGDGKLDLITDTVSVALGNGDGTFTAAGGVSLGGDFSFFINLADFNGDGKIDIALAPTDANGKNQSLMILLGKGDGTFRHPITFSSAPASYPPWSFAMGDFNHDGRIDLILGSSSATDLYQQQHP
jgi:hypothetical protein